MKILFIYSGYESLGLEILSALLRRAGHETALAFDPRLFDDHYTRSPALARRLDLGRRVVARAEEERPDLLAFSVVTDDYPWASSMAADLRRRLGVPVVFGGVHVSAVPHVVMANPAVDYAVVGEGEETLLELVTCLERGEPPDQVQNLWFRRDGEVMSNPVRPLIQDLDALPFPDKELFYRELPYLRRDYVIMTSRGCPHRCSYCFNGEMQRLYARKGPYVRRRGVEDTVEELRQARAAYPLRRVMFYDDSFTSDREWLEALAGPYRREIAVPFWCSTNPTAVDREVARLLAEMGCWEVQMGVQTVDHRLRRQVLARPESVEQVRQAVALLREAGIKVVLDSISGIPGEGEAQLRASLSFYNEVRPSRISDYYLRYYPGTRATRDALEQGVLDREQAAALDQGLGSESFALGGTLGEGTHQRIHLLRALLLHLPAPLNRLILRRRLYRLLPSSLPLVRGLLRLAEVLRQGDINAERYMRKYIKFLAEALECKQKT